MNRNVIFDLPISVSQLELADYLRWHAGGEELLTVVKCGPHVAVIDYLSHEASLLATAPLVVEGRTLYPTLVPAAGTSEDWLVEFSSTCAPNYQTYLRRFPSHRHLQGNQVVVFGVGVQQLATELPKGTSYRPVTSIGPAAIRSIEGNMDDKLGMAANDGSSDALRNIFLGSVVAESSRSKI